MSDLLKRHNWKYIDSARPCVWQSDYQCTACNKIQSVQPEDTDYSWLREECPVISKMPLVDSALNYIEHYSAPYNNREAVLIAFIKALIEQNESLETEIVEFTNGVVIRGFRLDENT